MPYVVIWVTNGENGPNQANQKMSHNDGWEENEMYVDSGELVDDDSGGQGETGADVTLAAYHASKSTADPVVH